MRNLQHKTSQITSHMLKQAQHRLHTLHKSCFFFFFAFQLLFLPFMKSQSIICQKCCFTSSIFNIKMVEQKFTSFDMFFKKSTLI